MIFELIQSSVILQAGLLLVSSIAIFLLLGRIVRSLIEQGSKLLSLNTGDGTASAFFERVFAPQLVLISGVILLTLLDIATWIIFKFVIEVSWYSLLEFPLTLSVSIALGWLLSRLFQGYFESYILKAATRDSEKVNGEFLVLAKFFANFAIVVILIVVFAQTHNLNIFGVLASLGIGGIAIAFSAQKVLEQLLGGVVIYVDRPFEINDYIGLPDGTYGRVESIGLRSTKIRTSGKGTLAIVPNNTIIQSTVENFTGAKKVMALLNLSFSQCVSDEEQALIRQVVIDTTQDISGLDGRRTDVVFRVDPEREQTQAQITFFILGSGDTSMNIRRQLLSIASQNLTDKLKTYGIVFELETPTVYVDSPITI
ncbi:MAG: mechanosensitive ion channel domain-containing protein [Leptolyngbyaceae bacterium]|nr:mechanosensitive ion channel domain-containing protein [Leptolyngbyaceae bacterium]